MKLPVGYIQCGQGKAASYSTLHLELLHKTFLSLFFLPIFLLLLIAHPFSSRPYNMAIPPCGPYILLISIMAWEQPSILVYTSRSRDNAQMSSI